MKNIINYWKVTGANFCKMYSAKKYTMEAAIKRARKETTGKIQVTGLYTHAETVVLYQD